MVPDAIMWLHNKNGIYSVKSGYHIARLVSKEAIGMMESSRLKRKGLTWPKLWKYNLPSKIKVFGWRVCQGILPTKENLSCRKIVEDNSGDFCRQGAESILHVLWECGVAQDVWAGSKVCSQKCTTGRGDILQLIEDLMARLTVDDMELFFVQCWVIWNQRNSVLYGGSIQDPSQLVRRAEDYLKEYRDAQDHLL